MSVRLRRAVDPDLGALLALESQFPGDRLSSRSLRRLLRSPSAQLWVADIDGHPVAGAAVMLLRRRSRVARLYSLVVDARHRHAGIARALVAQIESEAMAAGCCEVRLETRTDNHAAVALYRSLGYQPAEKLPGYYADGADGLRWSRPLAPLRSPTP